MIKNLVYKPRYLVTRGQQFDARDIINNLSQIAHDPLPPADGKIAVFIPARNAADHILPLGELLARLDFPHDRLRIVFCKGDSEDKTTERIEEFAKKYGQRFSCVTILKLDVGNSQNVETRHFRKYQRKRRSNIAKVRNHMIHNGLNMDDNWVLWLDADVCHFPSDILSTLTEAKGKIVTPNCVKTPGGDSFDMNSFVNRNLVKDYRYYRDVKDGLHQPPASSFHRFHLSDFRHLDKIELNAVGGTMLLVDASLHRAGLIFPEYPYEDLIETEALGALANHSGINPVGLPSDEIRHVPW